jgi:hypothetical protein
MIRVEYIQETLHECRLLQRNNSGAPFENVAVQLEYILKVLKGEQMDKSKLKDINIGLIAIREFDTRFPEFADRLMETEKVVEDIRYGR